MRRHKLAVAIGCFFLTPQDCQVLLSAGWWRSSGWLVANFWSLRLTQTALREQASALSPI